MRLLALALLVIAATAAGFVLTRVDSSRDAWLVLGTGLGLSLSHGIIERHRGRIRVESEPGHGATFVIDLPLDATPLAEASPAA